jgi:hypothetical protein
VSTCGVSDEQHAAQRRLQAAVDEMMGALRIGPGMDETKYAELREPLIAFGKAWEAEQMLPKSAVNILVGLSSWIETSSYLYSGSEAERIRRIAIEIDSLIFRHIVPAERPLDRP